jgi:hypothetical protein
MHVKLEVWQSFQRCEHGLFSKLERGRDYILVELEVMLLDLLIRFKENSDNLLGLE